MLDEVGLLAERFGADFAAEGFLAGVRSQVDLDVALVEEPPVADVTPVHGFVLAEQAAEFAGCLEAERGLGLGSCCSRCGCGQLLLLEG